MGRRVLAGQFHWEALLGTALVLAGAYQSSGANECPGGLAAGTGAAFVWFATLAGRVGPTRSSITTAWLNPGIGLALAGSKLKNVDH